MLRDISNFMVPIRRNVSFSELTTFRLGGSCPGLMECASCDEVRAALGYCLKEKLLFSVLGWGSNVLVSDQGLDDYIIRFFSKSPRIQRKGNELIVEAGTLLDDLILFSIQEGLEGLEFASGIPGTVGGAIVGNAGAFGRQVGDHLQSVEVIGASGEEKELEQKDLGFSYRCSKFKESQGIILKAVFSLDPGDSQKLKEERARILNLRRDKHPDPSLLPCAGSFFRNILKAEDPSAREAAGWFLDQCNVKKLFYGGAAVYEKHANIIVKKDSSCTAQDVYDLSVKMQNLVKEKFDIDLIPEVQILGAFEEKK